MKVRGFRIELGEIETVLTRHPSVKEAVVTARGSDAEAELAAYVVVSDPAPSAKELRDHAGASLTPYMVPSTVTFLEAFPLTPNGKVDRKALPDPTSTPGRRLVSWHPPMRSSSSSRRCGRNSSGSSAWASTTTSSHLGGHSLLAVRLVQMVQDRLSGHAP